MSGRNRSHRPVAVKMALATAGVTAMSGVCPAPGPRPAVEVTLALGRPIPPANARLPYSRIPGERVGVGDR